MMYDLIEKLFRESNLKRYEFLYLLENLDSDSRDILRSRAREVKETYYGKDVYLRGLVEYSNTCTRNCLYCGIRRDNTDIIRYRMSGSDILNTVSHGYSLGFKTFVIQGGEDDGYGVEDMAYTLSEIRSRYPDVAITLSLGEMSYQSYKSLYHAGADRYLLRHETASKKLYKRFHPDSSLENRKRCLKDLKQIGFEVGSGFLVGLPGQTKADLVEDILYLKELEPQMIGIGPFIPHSGTPLGSEACGGLELVLDVISIVRLSNPKALMPSTTALGTVHESGREEGLLAGCNVLMPNLNNPSYKSKYLLYDGKICLDESLDACMACLSNRVLSLGYVVNMDRGNSYGWGR